MEINEKSFFEYIKCPLRYEFVKHNIDLGQDRTFKKLVYSAINYYYAAKTNGLKNNVGLLKKKWDNICEQNQDIINPKKVLEGWGLLYRTYEYIEDNNITFMDINTPYTIEIPGSKISLKGQLDPLIDKDNYIEIFITCFDKVVPDRLSIETKLKHTIDAYAIKDMFNKDVVINYYVPAQNKCIQAIRSNKDFIRLKTIITNVGKSIENNIIYPRETFMCSNCLARDICKSWTGSEGGEIEWAKEYI